MSKHFRALARLAVPAGSRRGRVAGYVTQAERHGRQQRLQVLRARLAEAERQLDAGRVSVCRGGRDLLRKRNSLASAGLGAERWRQQWDAARMFLTADGEAGKPLGNETIRWDPGGGQRTASRRAAPTAPAAPGADRNGRPRKAQRQPPRWRKTATADRAPPPDQAAHDRPGPPAEQRTLPLSV